MLMVHHDNHHLYRNVYHIGKPWMMAVLTLRHIFWPTFAIPLIPFAYNIGDERANIGDEHADTTCKIVFCWVSKLVNEFNQVGYVFTQTHLVPAIYIFCLCKFRMVRHAQRT